MEEPRWVDTSCGRNSFLKIKNFKIIINFQHSSIYFTLNHFDEYLLRFENYDCKSLDEIKKQSLKKLREIMEENLLQIDQLEGME